MERSTFIWYYDGSDAKAREIANTGATIAWIKAGGDRGIAWIPNAPTGGFAQPQWDDAYLAPLTNLGITCYPWIYNWPTDADKEVCLRLLAHRWADRICLNAESEWRVQHGVAPYTSLSKGNAYAAEWIRDLRRRLVERFGRAPQIDHSCVPSWSDFPYEAYAEECTVGFCQHYWHDELMARGENQVEAHYRRAPAEKPCVPILTACREYDDAGVLALARSALLHPIDGFSSWEAGNRAWQADAMRRAYLLLPPDDQPAPLDAVTALRRLIANLARPS